MPQTEIDSEQYWIERRQSGERVSSTFITDPQASRRFNSQSQPPKASTTIDKIRQSLAQVKQDPIEPDITNQLTQQIETHHNFKK